MSRCEGFNTIFVPLKGCERATVQTGFDLCEYSGEFFKCEFVGGYNSPEVGLHALNSSFPKTTEVGCTLWNESPPDVLVGAELGYFLLCLLAFEKISKFLELSGSANKICPRTVLGESKNPGRNAFQAVEI